MLNSTPNSSANDKNFLKDVIANIERLLDTIPDQFITIKDRESVLCYISKPYADFLHRESEQIVGTKKWSPLLDDVDIVAIINNEDKEIINTRQSQTGFRITIVNGILKPYWCIKSPIINPESNNVIGIFAQAFQHGIINLHEELLNLPGKSDRNKPHIDKLPYLNRREKQVIFFFMAHLSSQKIVEALYLLDGKRITKGTIDSVFNQQLYIKFAVTSRIALYNKLESLGFNKLIPQDVLTVKANTSTQLKSY